MVFLVGWFRDGMERILGETTIAINGVNRI
jgi:hypothetical protein